MRGGVHSQVHLLHDEFLFKSNSSWSIWKRFENKIILKNINVWIYPPLLLTTNHGPVRNALLWPLHYGSYCEYSLSFVLCKRFWSNFFWLFFATWKYSCSHITNVHSNCKGTNRFQLMWLATRFLILFIRNVVYYYYDKITNLNGVVWRRPFTIFCSLFAI